MDNATMLAQLLPTAERLVDRHLGMAKEWFPHDLVEWRPPPDVAGGRAPARRCGQCRLRQCADGGQSAVLLLFNRQSLRSRRCLGLLDGRWTAEEGRHSIVLRDYLIMSGHVDPVKLERARMAQVTGGVSPDAATIADPFVDLALQELATRIAHHSTGKALPDAEGYAVMKRVAADENLHHLFYRDLVTAAREIDSSGMMEAIKRQVLGFEMPGTGIPDFAQHAKAIARAGIYDLSVHYDSILRPVVLGHWDVAGRQGLSPSAEAARERLLQFITRLGRASARSKSRESRSVAVEATR